MQRLYDPAGLRPCLASVLYARGGGGLFPAPDMGEGRALLDTLVKLSPRLRLLLVSTKFP